MYVVKDVLLIMILQELLHMHPQVGSPFYLDAYILFSRM